MRRIFKIFVVLVMAIPIIFNTADNNMVYAEVSGDYSYEIIDQNTVTIINYGGSEKNLIIPETIDGKTVKKIGYGAFAECKSIETLVIPDTVTTINNYAFSQCSQLRVMSIPDSVVSIGQYAFAGCSSLEKLKIPNEIKAISYGAFFDCTNLREVEIPEGIQTIGGMVFGNCKSLVQVNFPNTLTSIGGNAFSNCVGLKSIVIPEGVTVLGSGAFQGCLSLREAFLPNTLISIGQSAFQDCISLESMILPENVTGIGYAAFSGCASLKEINIPKKVILIGNATFSGCASLETLEIPTTVTSLGDNVFSGCVNLKNIVIPDSVIQIGDSTFSYCSNLESVKLPKNLKSIATSLFRYCDKIETIVIPNGVTSIGSTAFADCLNLKSVTFPDSIGAGTSSIGSRIFSNSPKVVSSVIENSAAHTYMRRNQLPFNLITTGINLDKINLEMNVGESTKYVAILSPYNIADNSKLIWKSSNQNVATVNNLGIITAKSEGETIITVETLNGLKAQSVVTVKNEYIPITSVSLNQYELVMKKETSKGLRATVSPSNTTEDKKLTWRSSDNEVVTVSSTGLLTARKPGKAVITVLTSNGISSSCDVTVISEISSVSLNLSAMSIEEGMTQLLRATINPIDTTDSKELIWKSSNQNVAIVNQNGEVTALRKGTATITVESVNGKKAECKITVIPAIINIPITSVDLNKTSLTLEEEQSETLIATINPSNTTDDKTLIWNTSDSKIATVDEDGKVTAISEGTATITVESVNGKKAECRITVTKKSVPIESVELNKKELTLKAGKSELLFATINPEETTDDKTLIWTSSNKEVATVENGMIYAHKSGQTEITVSTSNGKIDTCIVNVFELNTDELRDLIKTAEEKEDIYTKDSFETLKTAILEGKTVLSNDEATQDEIDLIVDLLKQALDGLVVRASQTTLDLLYAKIDECKELENSYTQEEFFELKQVIIKAEILLNGEKNNISDQDANKALNDLIEATNALYLNKAIDNLENSITLAKEILSGDLTGYVESKITALQNAVDKAQFLIDNQSKDIELIKSADETLKTAISEMEKIIVNKDNLEKLIIYIDQLDANKYSVVSWQKLQEKLSEAKLILNDDTVLQEDVDKIYEELSSAFSNLVLKVDKYALLFSIDCVENIVNNIDKYRSTSVLGIEELLVRANQLYLDDSATQEEIDGMTRELVIAIMNARLKVI